MLWDTRIPEAFTDVLGRCVFCGLVCTWCHPGRGRMLGRFGMDQLKRFYELKVSVACLSQKATIDLLGEPNAVSRRTLTRARIPSNE